MKRRRAAPARRRRARVSVGRGDAGDQPAAADRADDQVGVRHVLGDLEPDRPLPGDHERVVERGDVGAPGLLDELAAGARTPRCDRAPRGRPQRRSRGWLRPSAGSRPRHMTTRQSIPSLADAQATACAWFPADQVTTPRAFSSALSDASLFSTPRGLNEPVFWNSSAFRNARAPMRSPSVADVKTGVRCRRPAIVSRAASTSSRVGDSIVIEPRLSVAFSHLGLEAPISRPLTAGLGERVLGPGAALGRGEPAALGGDRAALDAVRRRDDDLHLAGVRRGRSRTPAPGTCAPTAPRARAARGSRCGCGSARRRASCCR